MTFGIEEKKPTATVINILGPAPRQRRIEISVDGVYFMLDYTNADVALYTEIDRHVKGIFRKLQERARERAEQS